MKIILLPALAVIVLALVAAIEHHRAMMRPATPQEQKAVLAFEKSGAQQMKHVDR